MNREVIAGPCALESREQLRAMVALLRALGVRAVRASLWKPRTRPGWSGMGALSLPVLFEETLPHGVVPATEVLTCDQARLIVEAAREFGEEAEALLWLGARNQNHLTQSRIAEVVAAGPKGVRLMAKNQMWEDEAHWLGIFEHLEAAGMPRERLLACHRGFSPSGRDNPRGFRNLPHFEMAMRVKEATGLPMILDPSHIGGSRENVHLVTEEALSIGFDGLLLEVHVDPQNARTDGQQQLDIEGFKRLLRLIEGGIDECGSPRLRACI